MQFILLKYRHLINIGLLLQKIILYINSEVRLVNK